MPVRPGHHRPLGTTTRMRLRWREGEVDDRDQRDPQLGDIVFEVSVPDGFPAEMRRGFRVVGVEEPAPGAAWGIVLERLDYDAAVRESLERPWWCFYRDRR